MGPDLLAAFAEEVTRLLAAGTGAGAPDVGFARRTAELHALGDHVPALRPLAEAAARLSGGALSDAPGHLLDLVTRLSQVRAAFAGAGALGTLTPILPSGPWATSLTDAELGSWRADFRKRPTPACRRMTTALDAGQPLDPRLWDVLPAAASRVYGANENNLTPRRLPSWVVPLLPDLRERYDPSGGKPDALNLSLLCRLDRGLGLELCREGLDRGSLPVQRVATRWLAELADPAEVLARLGPRVGELPDEMAAPVAAALAHTGFGLIPRLLGLLGPPPAQARQASLVLKELAPHQADALRPHAPALLAALDSGDGQTFANLVEVLAALAPLADDPTPRMLHLVRHLPAGGQTGRPTRKDALEGMARLGFRWDLARPVVLDLAQTDSDPWTRRVAQRCLATAAAAGVTEAAETLVKFLGDSPTYCPSVACLFDRLGVNGAPAVPGLVRILTIGHGDLCREAMRALLGLGSVALPAAEVVAVRARAGSADAAFAVRVLGKLGPAVPEGLPLILAALDSPTSDVRWQAWYALERYHPPGDIPVGPLVEKLTAADGWVRHNAARLLRRLGPAAASAVPALRRALDDPDGAVRKAAGSALSRLERLSRRG